MQHLNRRAALKWTGVASSGLVAASVAEGVATALEGQSLDIVDTNVHLGRWPFRRLPLDTIDKLTDKLADLGVRSAWAGTFEALLHRDLGAVNARLAASCADHSRVSLTPMGAINPRLTSWEEDLRVCNERHQMLGVRIYPNYHNYTLSSTEFATVLAAVAKRGMLLQIVVAMEDARTQHPSMRAADVDLSPLPAVLGKVPQAQVQLLNFRPRSADIATLGKLPNVYFDTARVESTDGVPTLAKAAPARTLFGSHAPLLVPEAAAIRVFESGQLHSGQLKKVYHTNAASLAQSLKRRGNSD